MANKQSIKRVLAHCSDEDEFAYAIWGTGDAVSRAKERGIALTKKEARKVLYDMHRQHDASIGICWAVLDVHIDFVVAERK